MYFKQCISNPKIQYSNTKPRCRVVKKKALNVSKHFLRFLEKHVLGKKNQFCQHALGKAAQSLHFNVGKSISQLRAGNVSASSQPCLPIRRHLTSDDINASTSPKFQKDAQAGRV